MLPMTRTPTPRRATFLGRGAAAVLALGIVGPQPSVLPDAAAAQSNQSTVAEFGERVLQYARTDLQEWIADPVLIFAIKEQNSLFGTLNETEIASMDKQWIDGGSRGLMVLEMLDRQASIIARDRREQAGGIITEIIVMDKYGLNVAISDRTSDFYQGDEAKYQKTFLQGADAVHISELEFDESTQQVQTQVSLTVIDPEGGAPIGAVTLGVRVDKLSE
jgi:hypothetical protein